MSDTEAETPDVLPPLATQTLAALWILLMGGRWLAFPFLMTNEHLSDLDDHILFPCYLVLLILTLVVMTLRLMRRGRAPVISGGPGKQDKPTHAETADTPAAPEKTSTSARSSQPRD